MAQSGFTPILTYASNTATSVPSAGNLTNSANGSELAVNTADKRLFTKDSGGTVVELGTNPSALTVAGTTTLSALTASTALALNSSKQVVSVTNTGTGNNVLSASPTLTGTIGAAALTLSSDLTLSAGTANGVTYLNGSKVLTSGSALTFNGTGLGVGIASASGNLDVYTAATSIGYVRTANQTLKLTADDAGNRVDIANVAGNPVSFTVGVTEGMRLTSTGLGIGTSSPAAGSGSTKSLEASGPLLSGGAINAHQTSKGVFQYSGNETTIRSYGATAGTGQIVFNIGGGGGSADTEGMRLSASGNLGLGVTPSAWATYKAIQNGQSAFMSRTGGSDCYILSNNYYDGTNFRYINTTLAARYQQDSGVHSWYTAPSGTAGNAISFTQAMTLDASGNLIVGGTAATNTAAGRGNITINGSSSSILSIGTGGAERGYVYTQGTDFIINASTGALNLQTAGASAMTFVTNNTERARITSGGNLLVGKTADDNTTAGVQVVAGGAITLVRNSASNCVQINKKGNAGDLMAFYYNDATVVGTITNSSTNTAYNTSSDRRLKENIAPAPSASSDIDAIQIVSHDWKSAPGEHVKYGVVAQDLHVVAPQAVSPGDDGTEIERTWGVDYSKLVPMLIKEVQSLRARVAALEA
jgi:hypothetical protein